MENHLCCILAATVGCN